MTLDLREAIEICICTYRRPSLIDTLRSVSGSKTELPLSILVIDNDATASAKAVIERFAVSADLSTRYVHCPGANISLARNAALAHSCARYLAFLDDDETAGPDWAHSLERTIKATGAAVVLGPVQAVYQGDSPAWMRQADLHSTAPVFVKGDIRTGYSCNVLIDRRHAAFDGLAFRTGLGRSGGEDTAFFTDAHERGARIAFAPEAIVYEAVPTERARFSWLAKRRYRMGQTHGRLLLRDGHAIRNTTGAALALAKVAYCACDTLISVLDPVRRNRALLRGCLHAGTLSAYLGLRSIELYGQSNKGITP